MRERSRGHGRPDAQPTPADDAAADSRAPRDAAVTAVTRPTQQVNERGRRSTGIRSSSCCSRWWPAALRVAVVVTSNIVRMAFYLVAVAGGDVGLFFLAGADFVGAMQLMIYVGGTLVLLVFGVMLTAQGPFVSMKTGGGRVDSGRDRRRLAVGRAACRPRSASTTGSRPRRPAGPTAAGRRPRRLGMGLLGVRVDKLDQTDATLQRRACRATCCRSKSSRSTCWSC